MNIYIYKYLGEWNYSVVVTAVSVLNTSSDQVNINKLLTWSEEVLSTETAVTTTE